MAPKRKGHWLKWPLAVATAVACLWLVFNIYATGQAVWAVGALVLFATGFFVYFANVAFPYRYLFPGLAGMAIFVMFPMVYTMQIGFTNYSSSNLLTQERAAAYLLDQMAPGEDEPYAFSLYAEGTGYRIVVAPKQDEEPDEAKAAELRRHTFVTPPLALLSPRPPGVIVMLPLAEGSFQPGEPLTLAEVLKRRKVLSELQLKLPDGKVLSYAGVREFGVLEPVWKRNDDGSLTLLKTGQVAKPNPQTGFFEFEGGEKIQPGYKVGIGFGNYARMVNDPEFRGPFFTIFL